MYIVYEQKSDGNYFICRCPDKESAVVTAQTLMFNSQRRRRIGIANADDVQFA